MDCSLCFAGNKGSNGASNSSNSGILVSTVAIPHVSIAAMPKTTGSTVKHNGITDFVLDADSSSTKSGRRPSVDTVSTYLSHESKESELRTSQVIEMCTIQ
jgi:deltex-like protein